MPGPSAEPAKRAPDGSPRRKPGEGDKCSRSSPARGGRGKCLCCPSRKIIGHLHDAPQWHRSAQGRASRPVGLSAHLHGDHLRSPLGFLERFQDFHCRYSSHQQGHVTFMRCLDGFPVDPLDVFGTRPNTTHSHNKFCIFHAPPVGRDLPVRDACAKTSAGSGFSAGTRLWD